MLINIIKTERMENLKKMLADEEINEFMINSLKNYTENINTMNSKNYAFILNEIYELFSELESFKIIMIVLMVIIVINLLLFISLYNKINKILRVGYVKCS
jgi:hypothetical protein